MHYNVGETGRNRWLWKKLKAAHLLKCSEYAFDWSNIDAVIIYDHKGRSLANTAPVPGRSRRATRMPIGARKDPAKFKRRILHVYQGKNEDGIAVYKTYHDKFFANQAALEKLHQDQLDVGTALDQEERAATSREGHEHPVPNHYLDEDNENAFRLHGTGGLRRRHFCCPVGAHQEAASRLPRCSLPSSPYSLRAIFPLPFDTATGTESTHTTHEDPTCRNTSLLGDGCLSQHSTITMVFTTAWSISYGRSWTHSGTSKLSSLHLFICHQ